MTLRTCGVWKRAPLSFQQLLKPSLRNLWFHVTLYLCWRGRRRVSYSSRIKTVFSHLPWIHIPHKSKRKRKSYELTSNKFNNLDPLLVLWFITSKLKHSTMSDSTSRPFLRNAKSSKFMSLSRAIKHSHGCSSWSSFLTESYIRGISSIFTEL